VLSPSPSQVVVSEPVYAASAAGEAAAADAIESVVEDMGFLGDSNGMLQVHLCAPIFLGIALSSCGCCQ